MGIARHMAEVSGERREADQMLSKQPPALSVKFGRSPIAGLCLPGFNAIIYRLSATAGLFSRYG